MSPRFRKAVDWTLGVALIVFGMIGGLIPILPGWVFVVAGLAVLSSHSPRARSLHLWVEAQRARIRARWKRAREASPGDDDRPAR